MERIGNDEAGFSVDVDAAAGAVRVRAWGFWKPDVAAVFGKTVGDACKSAPTGAVLDMDMTELKPMRDEGQASFGMLMGMLPNLGMAEIRVTTSSHLTKLQLLRIATEHGAKVAFVVVEPGTSKDT